MVHGHYSKLIATKKIGQLNCPNCKSDFDMQFETYCRVHHIMFIPFIAGKKMAFIGCGKCGSHYNPSAFPAHQHAAIDFTNQTKKRWYHFSGLVLLIALIATAGSLIFAGNRENEQRMADNFERLRANCVIFYNKAEGVNTSMLVSRAVGDTIFVHENSKSTNGSAYRIDDSDNYKGPETYFLKGELKKWLNDGKIKDITEPQTYAE